MPGVSLVALVLTAFSTGCQSAPSVSGQRLIDHQAMIDFSGLKSLQDIPSLKVTASVPQNWVALPLQDKALYVHQQWRSSSRNTGVGVAYIHLPIPLSNKLVVWLAKMQYARQVSKDGQPRGQLLDQWTDSLGREWFEAENEKYHVKGYALTNGFDAWIVYTGYRVRSPLNPNECSLAGRAMDSIVPTPLASEANDMPIVSAAP